MTQVALQPCAAKASMDHYADTIERPVAFAAYDHLLTTQERKVLTRAHPNGSASLWGVMPGARGQQVPKWERLEPGDHIFFAGGGRVFADAVLTAKVRNPRLAEELWGNGVAGNGDQQTWELMFAVHDVTPLDIPITDLNIAIQRRPNANVQEFVVLPRATSAAALTLLPTPADRLLSEDLTTATVQDIPIEAWNVEKYIAQRTDTSKPALRREAELVQAYVDWLRTRGQETCRQAIALPGGTTLYTDVFNSDTKELLEAKAAAGRREIREGLGQLLDYSRFVSHDTRALLVPQRPLPDLVELLHAYGLSAVWREGDEFFRSDRERHA